MGTVHLVERPDGSRLAVKHPRPDVAEAVLSTYRHLEGLSHPNVVAVYGLAESHGHLLISQELVAGGCLEDVIEERTKDGHSTTMDDCSWAAGICTPMASMAWPCSGYRPWS